MKFDCDKGDYGLVYDADGNLLPWPLRGDTETGFVECRVVGVDGQPLIDDSGNLRSLKAMFKAPLKLENFRRGDGW